LTSDGKDIMVKVLGIRCAVVHNAAPFPRRRFTAFSCAEPPCIAGSHRC